MNYTITAVALGLAVLTVLGGLAFTAMQYDNGQRMACIGNGGTPVKGDVSGIMCIYGATR